MAAQTKKEKIRTFFELAGFEEAIREVREEWKRMSNLTEEQKNIFNGFTDTMVETMRATFENVINEEFNKTEVEEFIAIHGSELYKRFVKAQKKMDEITAPKAEILRVQESQELSEASLFPGGEKGEA
ncbi:hypothetical protein MYX06_04385 [Patescibacteria group bacterium AH-259-L05]|nr:hypothetical protein [Patescibacteria group bacterium AH-259-L05]